MGGILRGQGRACQGQADLAAAVRHIEDDGLGLEEVHVPSIGYSKDYRYLDGHMA